MKKIIVMIMCFVSIVSKSHAQFGIDGVSYQLKYNADSCWYDVYLIINEGSASTLIERVQFNAQLSFVVPTGSGISIPRGYMPLLNNSTAGTGSYASNYWQLGGHISNPASAPGKDFWSVYPNINIGLAQYNNLNKGDTVKLFSVKTEPKTLCGHDLRFYKNGVDPQSNAAGMNGADFSNEFTIQNPANQVFDSLAVQVFPSDSIIVGDPIVAYSPSSFSIDVTTSTTPCRAPLSFSWTGPSSYTSINEDLLIDPLGPNENGLYKLVVTDAIGCKDSIMVSSSDKPQAGPDQTICLGSVAHVFGTNPTTGVWRALNNPGPSLLSSTTGMVTISNFGAPGIYYYEYATQTKSDTLQITVLPKPNAILTGKQDVCIGETTTVAPSSGGAWYSNNPFSVSVSNSGIVTGITPGTYGIYFTENSTGCNSDSIAITVRPKPIISDVPSTPVCRDFTINLSPSSGGTWSSSNQAVGTINNSGTVTAINAGSVNFGYTDSFGCVNYTSYLTVREAADVKITGPDSICVGQSTTLSPSTGGFWNGNFTAATTTVTGVVTGILPGQNIFSFTDQFGCVTTLLKPVTVDPSPIITISGQSTIEVNQTTTFTANAAGTWISLNPEIATVSSETGIVTGIKEGIAGIQFVSNHGCLSDTTFIEVKGNIFKISGFCFTDVNGNNIFDPNVDFPLPNVNINISNDSVTYYTNVNGYFDIPVDSGAVVMNNTIHFGNWVNDTIVRNLVIINPRTFVFVGFVPSSSGSNATGLAVASSSKAQCKSFANLYAQAFNASSQLADGYLIVAYDARTYINASSPLPSGGQDNYLVWAYNNLPPGKTFSPDIEYWVPDALSADDSLHFAVYMVELATGDTLSTFALAQAIECNGNINLDKARTWPDRAGDDNYTLVGEQISYNITFSNKGNGPASTAAIACTIDKNLDLASLKIQKSSHNFDVSSMNGILTFYADSIELDASTREGNSEVYVSFTLDQNPGLADKTKLYLDAELSLNNGYKDKSNTVINTIVGILPCDLINDGITKIGNNLSVTSAGTTHTWYDCITGVQVGNGSTFKPSDNGKFYCVIEGLACKQQTECFDFIYTNTDESDEASIKVYPNPVQDALYIDCAATTVYTVVKDMMGREILHTYDRQIPLRDFTRGMYLLKIKFGEHEVVKRIVKL